MGNRFMRILVMFDLPVNTVEDRKEYRKFRKYLIKNGFMMMQESVYCKIAVNPTMGDAISAGIRKNKPKSGLVQLLKITEKQYAKIEYVVGKKQSEVIDSDERLVIL